MSGFVKELYEYRSMILNLVKRDLRGRYKGSLLGFLWNFVLPMMQIIVYVLVFSVILKQNLEHYYVFLIAGIVPWFFFSDSISAGSGSIIDNSQLITKIYFPRSVIPVSIVLSKFVNFCISMVIVFVILAIEHGFDLLSLTILPLSILCIMLFSMGLALLLSALNVYMRDVQYIITVLLMMWIWLTPIMYSADFIDNSLFQMVLSCNPVTALVDMFHDPLYWKVLPSLTTVCIGVAESIVMMLVGILVFEKLSPGFAEVI